MDFRILCLICIIPKLLHGANIIVREEQTKVLRCMNGRVINVQYAKYEGRPIYCSKNEVTSIVQTLCQGQTSCTLKATDEVYTDSCAMANEVLTVRYNCNTPIVTLGVSSTPIEVTTLEQDIDNCFYGLQETTFYNGTTSTTVSGRTCQRWDAQTPHIPQHWPVGEGHENFCRSPDGDGRPWCYTVDPTRRWEYCNISQCAFGNGNNTTTETTIQTRGSMQNNIGSKNVMIVALIGGCIVGLIVTAVIIIAVYRRRSKGKVDTLYTDHETINTRPQSDEQIAFQNRQQTMGYTNNIYQKSNEISSQETKLKTLYDTEYSYVDEASMPTSDNLPSQYDVAREQNSVVLKNGTGRYNFAHYFETTYDKPKTNTRTTTDNGYTTPNKVVCVSSKCQSCLGGKEEKVYENEDLGIETKVSKTLDYITDISEKVRKENPYANVTSSNGGKYLYDHTSKDQRYMPMTYGSSTQSHTEDNVYVPVMSPSYQGLKSDVFDDTYRY